MTDMFVALQAGRDLAGKEIFMRQKGLGYIVMHGLEIMALQTAGGIDEVFLVLQIADPVKGFCPEDLSEDILGTIIGLHRYVVKYAVVGKMAVHAFCGKAQIIHSPMDVLGIGLRDGLHGMAGRAESPAGCPFNHLGCK